MSRGVKFLLKWLLVPGALAAVGYAYVGPRLGGELAEKAARRLQKSGLAEKIPGALNTSALNPGGPNSGAPTSSESRNEPQPSGASEPEPDGSTERAETSSGTSSGPSIKVDVAPAESRPRSESNRRRSHRSDSSSTRPKASSDSSSRPRSEGKSASSPAEPQSDPAGIGTGAAPGGTEDPEPGRPSTGGGVPL